MQASTVATPVMRTHVDWLTFTMSPRYGTYDASNMSVGEDYAAAIEQAWIATFDAETLANAFGGEWEKLEKSRAPYTDAWTLVEAGISLFAGIHLNHCCVEISGKGCEILIEKNLLEKCIMAVQERITRIDIAADIETSISPLAFVGSLRHDRMRSSGHQLSASGETCYVGSRKSERYARVYRYFEPHPRSAYLRVEHVFRGDYACNVGRAIINSGLDNVASTAGKAFGWAHDTWQPNETTEVDLSVVKAERTTGSTVYWLMTQVAPAFKRLCAEGIIPDPEKFCRDYFIGID